MNDKNPQEAGTPDDEMLDVRALIQWALRVVRRQMADDRVKHPEMTDEEFHEWYAAEQNKQYPSNAE